MWEHFASLATEQNLLDGFLTAHPFSCLCILGCPDTAIGGTFSWLLCISGCSWMRRELVCVMGTN